MEFKYNGHLTFKERVSQVSNEITAYYKDIDKNKANMIAGMEDVITTDVNPIIKFKRLYNIMFIMQQDKNIFNKVYIDLVKVFREYLESKLEDEKIDKIMEEIIKYKKQERLYFPVISEFY